jgi:hypothetical protein
VLVVVLVVLVELVVELAGSLDDPSPPCEARSLLSVTCEWGVTTTTSGRAGRNVVRRGALFVVTVIVVVTPGPTCNEFGRATAGPEWVRMRATSAAMARAPTPQPNIHKGWSGRRPTPARAGRLELASGRATRLNLLPEVMAHYS